MSPQKRREPRPGGTGRLFGGGRRAREIERAEQDAADRAQRERVKRTRLEEIAALPQWTDSHCHLQHLASDEEVRQVLERARDGGVRRFVVAGTDAESSRRAVEIATSVELAGQITVGIWATIGLHPHDAKLGTEELLALAEELSPGGYKVARVVAIGECGLDYHYDNSPRHLQREVFAAQVRLANELGLALVVHSREAWDDTIAILRAEGAPPRTVLHCFTGGPEEAKRCLALGAYLSYSGIVTFTSAEELREAVRATPLDHMLVETDTPFLTPAPHRGRPNEPVNAAVVGAAVAAAKGLPVEEVARATSSNASVVFDLH